MKIVNKSILDKILFHWKEIAINNGHVDIFYSNKYSVSIDIDKIDSISSSTFFCFFHRLEIQCGKKIYSIKYIPRENVDIFIQNACDGIFRHKLNILHKLVEEYAEKEFLRDSSVDFIKHNFEFIKNSYEDIKKITEKYIDVDCQVKLTHHTFLSVCNLHNINIPLSEYCGNIPNNTFIL